MKILQGGKDRKKLKLRKKLKMMRFNLRNLNFRLKTAQAKRVV